MNKLKVGIIGGSGLGQSLLANSQGESYNPRTPFGRPSAPIICTQFEGVDVCIPARHGQGHRYSPSHVPYRANIFAMKMLGVTHIIASGAVGSLREDVHPGDLLIPDQAIDKTFKREGSFFGDGIVAHVEFDQPFCPQMQKLLFQAGQKLEGDVKVHEGGTYICMEGPQFSSRAESLLHRQWGGSVIGMTCMPEAKLAREAEICYGLVTLPTDYDCWKPKPANMEKRDLLKEIIGNMNTAAENAIKLIKSVVSIMPEKVDFNCACQSSLELGIWTDRTMISPATIRELEPLVGKYLGHSKRC
ncbi:MAG: S-methyl-5'-thioadenosine phosphorylase [Phycisphaerae bacterium]|nr:S-methyl-5'-thioadenosine phosphorylase [Phycisphaerae bacterium]